MVSQRTQDNPQRTANRSPGYWLAVLGALYLLGNAVWAAFAPAAFAHRFGLPLANPADDGLVYVYASRSALIAILALVLALRRDLRALVWLVLLAALLPFVDAILVVRAHAGTATAVRQLVSGGYLVLTAVLLARSARRR